MPQIDSLDSCYKVLRALSMLYPGNRTEAALYTVLDTLGVIRVGLDELKDFYGYWVSEQRTYSNGKFPLHSEIINYITRKRPPKKTATKSKLCEYDLCDGSSLIECLDDKKYLFVYSCKCQKNKDIMRVSRIVPDILPPGYAFSEYQLSIFEYNKNKDQDQGE